jgi:hypothetical protein
LPELARLDTQEGAVAPKAERWRKVFSGGTGCTLNGLPISVERQRH